VKRRYRDRIQKKKLSDEVKEEVHSEQTIVQNETASHHKEEAKTI